MSYVWKVYPGAISAAAMYTRSYPEGKQDGDDDDEFWEHKMWPVIWVPFPRLLHRPQEWSFLPWPGDAWKKSRQEEEQGSMAGEEGGCGCQTKTNSSPGQHLPGFAFQVFFSWEFFTDFTLKYIKNSYQLKFSF